MIKMSIDKSLLDLVQQWPERIKRMGEAMTLELAQNLHKDILDKIPTTPEYKDYRDSITVAKVQGNKLTSYAVYVDPKSKKVKDLNPTKTLIYIQAKRVQRRLSPQIEFLIKHSPWTLATLPFSPDKTQATIQYRPVTATEVAGVEKSKKLDRPRLSAAMSAFGMSMPKEAIQIDKSVRSMPDAAFQAVRMEFGNTASTPTMHWRPALVKMQSQGFRMLSRNRNYTDAFTKLAYNGWKKWPNRISKTVSMTTVLGFQGFERLLKLR